MQPLIDAHAHLDRVHAIETAVENARSAGLRHVVGVGMNLSSNKKIMEIAGRFPGLVLPAIGYHPWMILENDVDNTLAYLESHIEHCVAMGEIGLDYKVKVKKNLQIDVFSKILGLARAKNKPVITHSRFSHKRTHAMVSDMGLAKAVFHWYSGPLDILDRIIEDGYYISATPALAYSPPHQEAVLHTPVEQILIETDSPVEYQGRVSEPAHLLDTLHHLSMLKNLPKDELAGITTRNAESFFGLTP